MIRDLAGVVDLARDAAAAIALGPLPTGSIADRIAALAAASQADRWCMALCNPMHWTPGEPPAGPWTWLDARNDRGSS